MAISTVAVCTLATAAPAFNLHLVPRSTLERLDFRWKATGFRTEYEVWRVMKENGERWSDLGRALALVAQPGESLIRGVIGAVGYYSRLFIYDRYGLVTREVALLPTRQVPVQPGHDRVVSRSSREEMGHRALQPAGAQQGERILQMPHAGYETDHGTR